MIFLGNFLYSKDYIIVGQILDYKNNQPINSVNIYIQNTTIGTTSDIDGNFKLYLSSKLNDFNLVFSMIGYKKQILQLKFIEDNIDLKKVILIPRTLELESIHVHSKINNQISDISLSGQQLNKNIRGNLAETLSNQSNIGVNSFGFITSKPVIRGLSGDRFLIIKDGSEMGDLSVTSIDHVITLDINEINEIEIIRGPKTLLYGNNAIGGIIKTQIDGNPKVRVNKFRSKFTLGGESFNSGLYGSTILYIPYKKFQINLITNRSKTSNQTSPNLILDNTFSDNHNHKVGFTKYDKTGYTNFIYEQFYLSYGIPPSLEGHIDGVDIQLKKNTFQFNYHRDIELFDFNEFDIRYDYIDYEHQEYENNADYFSVSLSKKTYNFNLDFKSTNLEIGSRINYKKFLPGGFFWTPKTDELDISLYSLYKKTKNKINLLASFRIGQTSINPEIWWSFSNLDNEQVTSKLFQYISSSIGISKRTQKFEFDTWIMQTMKPPRVEELYSDGPHLGTYSYEIGKPNLQLEEIYGIESSIKYNDNFFNIILVTFLNYSPYYYQMTKMGQCHEPMILGDTGYPCAGADYIEWGSGSTGWLYKYNTQNIKSILKGVELKIAYKFFNNISITYDFSLVRGDDLTNNKPLSYINPTKQILNLSLLNQNNSYGFRFSKIHAQDRFGEFESFTPSTFLVDFIASFENKNQNITFQIKNIFNKKYYNHLSRIKSIMPEPGINILFNYKLFL